MKHILLMALLLGGASGAMAEGKNDGPTPQQLHQQFMGYAQEYRDEANKWSQKADSSDDTREAALLRQVAGLSRQLAVQKERMAQGFLNNDASAVEQAEAAYQKLSREKEALWKSFHGK